MDSTITTIKSNIRIMDSLSSHTSKKQCYIIDMGRAGRPAELPRSNFGERVFDARERAGLSQKDVAEALGVSQQLVAAWERKARCIRIDLLPKLAQLLNVTTDELTGCKPIRENPPGPKGKLRKLLQRASNLSKRQQDKIADVLDPFVEKYERTN